MTHKTDLSGCHHDCGNFPVADESVAGRCSSWSESRAWTPRGHQPQTRSTQEEKLMLAVAPKAALEIFGSPKSRND